MEGAYDIWEGRECVIFGTTRGLGVGRGVGCRRWGICILSTEKNRPVGG